MALVAGIAGCALLDGDTKTTVALDRKGERITIDGAPNGLLFDEDSGRLYIVDSANHRLLVRQTSGEITEVCRIEPPGGEEQRLGLGGLTGDGQGNLYLVRLPFKERKYGGIFRVNIVSGKVAGLSGIDDRWRRVGLTYAAERKALYVATFDKLDQGGYEGWIEIVDPDAGGENRLVDGFQKPVGIARIGERLLVTDQKAGQIVSVDLAGEQPVREILIDNLPEPDLMIVYGDGFFFTAFDEEQKLGFIFRSDFAGNYEQIKSGSWQPRGIAYDGRGMLYISLHMQKAVLALPVSLP